MTPYVLDTDTLTLFERKHAAVVHNVQQHPLNELAVTVISVEEQLTGWQTRLRRAQRRDELARIYQRLTDGVQCLAQFRILSFPEPAILRYEQLKAQNLNIGKMDLRIAAIVLEHGGTLVTRNLRDFQRVLGLALVDWSV
jgi:tRNA(fMet)-specific endonuclease VapC